MESIGETLREARHSKKVTLEDAARVTKIKFDILEKLESDEFDRLAGPMYTKAFLKLYADYLGLDGQAIADAYLQSQGGLRRHGLHLETEASVRARKPRELQLSLASVVLVVAGLTVLVVAIWFGTTWWNRRSQAVVVEKPPATMPKADFDAYYQPKVKPAPELLEPPKP